MSLRKCWQMPVGKTQSTSSDSSSKKRKFKGKGFYDSKCRQGASDIKSPASNLAYEVKGKPSFYKGKKGDNKSEKSSQFKSRKPFQGKQSKSNSN